MIDYAENEAPEGFWDDVYNNKMVWDNIDLAALANEFDRLNAQAAGLAERIDKIIASRDYETMKERIAEFYRQQLSDAGFIGRFRLENKNDFPSVAPAPKDWKPSWYNNMDLSKQKKYEEVLKYHQDAMWLANVGEKITALLISFPAEKCYKLQILKENLDEEKFTRSWYDSVNADIKAVSEQISQPWDVIERRAKRSQKFLEQNRGKLPKDKLLSGYRKERLQDYLDDLSDCPFNQSITLQNASRYEFECKPGIYTKCKVIDNYTYEISRFKNFDDDLKKSIEQCVRIENENLTYVIKMAKSQNGRSLFTSLSILVNAVRSFLESGLEVFNGFKNKDDNAPYCYMKILSSYASMSSLYGFGSQAHGDPWDMGTFYLNIYSFGRTAISRHCKDFVENHGWKPD